MASEKKLLNPKAVEFRPSSLTNPFTFPAPSAGGIHHPPVPPPLPPPQPAGFYPQPPPMMIYYHHHHHFLSPLPVVPPSKLMSPPNFYLTKPDMMLPLADDGLGLITSPTSPTSPFELNQSSSTNPCPKFFYKKSAPKNHSGRIRRCSGGDNRSSSYSWVKKCDLTDDAPVGPVPLAAYPFGDCTSLMIRNIPVRLSRGQLIRLLDEHCREENEKRLSDAEAVSAFDFLYLPIDFKKKGNLGYAFVNFTNWEGASRLFNCWSGSNWESCSYNTKKICQINPAKFQGEELKKHCERSRFECESDEYLPVEISPPRDGSNAEVTKLTTLGTRYLQLKTLGLL